MKILQATVFRTKMCGGGTSYDVYLTKADKQYEPISGNCYATTNCVGAGEYYTLTNFYRTKTMDALPSASDERWNAFKGLEKACKRLEFKIAKSAFPELKALGRMPFIADWTLDSGSRTFPVLMNDRYTE